jgi:hypothetical protein
MRLLIVRALALRRYARLTLADRMRRRNALRRRARAPRSARSFLRAEPGPPRSLRLAEQAPARAPRRRRRRTSSRRRAAVVQTPRRFCIREKQRRRADCSFPCIRAATAAVPHEGMWRQQITRASEARDRIVQAGVAFPADREPAKVVQPGERSFHTERTRPSPEPWSVQRQAITGFTPRRQLATVLVVVIAAIGDHRVRTATWWPSARGN